MPYQSLIVSITLLSLVLSACSSKPDSGEAYPNSLKEAFVDHFDLGATISVPMLSTTSHPAIAITKRHFNTITSENAFKWERINPSPDIYQFDGPEKFIKFGVENKLKMIGHTLFWHSQTPDWVFEDENGKLLSRERLLQRMRQRAQLMVDHFGDAFKTWDVVNEAFLDDGTLRPSKYHQIIGEDFIEQAFIIAEEVLPSNSELIYNDYNMFIPEKRNAAIALVKKLRAKNIKIDGVGMQGHWEMRTPLVAQIEKSIIHFANNNIPIHITELDIDYLGREEFFGVGANVDITKNVATLENNPYPKGNFPPAADSALSNRYLEIFEILLKHSAAIHRVSFWGVTDKGSWLNDWPVIGRTNYPLLFDRDGDAKPIVEKLIQLAFKAPKTTLKSAFKDKFLIGGALSNEHLEHIHKHPSLNIVKTHFNTITSTNALKWDHINPEPGVYTPELADVFVNFGIENNLYVVGHTLFWHKQTPDWVFLSASGQPASKELLLKRMREHTKYLAQRYGDKIKEWDVLNEAIEENGTLRDSPYYQILGSELFEHAFRIASEELPPGTKLLYNDYGMTSRHRVTKTIEEILNLRWKGIQIDGVGLQGHWEPENPSFSRIKWTLKAFNLFDIPTHITEFDVDLLGRSWFWSSDSTEARREKERQAKAYSAELADAALQAYYPSLFNTLENGSGNLNRLTFWGITDSDSWLNDWPIERTSYPFLFDRSGKNKLVLKKVLEY